MRRWCPPTTSSTTATSPSRCSAAIRAEADPETQFTPAEGAPGDVAKVLLSAARSGLRAIHLVGGDPLAHDSVLKEVQAVARTAVPFEVVPGIGQAAGVATYAGVPLPGVRVDRRRRRRRSPSTSRRSPPPSAAAPRPSPSTPATSPPSATGCSPPVSTPTTPVSVTGDGTGETQYSSASTVDSMVAAALGFAGRVVLCLGAGVSQREKLGWWENRPLYGWKVLVPRTKEQAGAMSERLRAYGAIPCEVPTIAVEPPRTPAQMERAIKGLVDGRYAWTVFTSVNAVRAVWEKFAEHGLDARHFGGVKVACIGEATAEAVRGFGIVPELIPAGEQSSEGLLAEFSPHDEILDPVGRVLLPRADIATETLAAGLTELGWEVDDVTAYRTVRAAPPPADIRDAIKSGGFDAVLFTSSSTVRNLVGIAGKPHARTVVAVIGPKTADTAVEFGLRVDVQPPHASVPDLVEALAGYAVELREKLAAMPAKQRRGSKVQGPTALRFR